MDVIEFLAQAVGMMVFGGVFGLGMVVLIMWLGRKLGVWK